MLVGIRKTGDVIDGDAMEDIGWPTVRQQEESSCPLIRVYVNVVNCYVMNTISAAGQSDSASIRADCGQLEACSHVANFAVTNGNVGHLAYRTGVYGADGLVFCAQQYRKSRL